MERIHIAHCRQMRGIRLLDMEAAADRFRRVDDAFDDAAPTGRFDDGIVNCRDQIAAAV
jgi:hypothetical protein